MGQPVGRTAPPVSTEELQAVLEPLLSEHFGGQCRTTGLRRKPSQFHSSFTLEELDVELDDGRRLQLIFKNLGWEALLPGARHAKPAFLYNPLREIETYRGILGGNPLGTATCYGAVVNPEAGRYWLFLERVRGLRLSHVGEFATWQQAARHLAALHNWFAMKVKVHNGPLAVQLLQYDRGFFSQWTDRAKAFVRAAKPAVSESAWRRLERLADGYRAVVDRLVALPRTFIHGEFYSSNVLVTRAAKARKGAEKVVGSHLQERPEGCFAQMVPDPLFGPDALSGRLCVVDWELAGLGPALIDVAALTAGNWNDDEKAALAMAYHSAVPAENGWPPAAEAFLTDLEFCRLHLAMQWLGWSLEWKPPREHARNWLGEALRLAEKLRLID
jgi:thiamine kinase-like enzyme